MKQNLKKTQVIKQKKTVTYTFFHFAGAYKKILHPPSKKEKSYPKPHIITISALKMWYNSHILTIFIPKTMFDTPSRKVETLKSIIQYKSKCSTFDFYKI